MGLLDLPKIDDSAKNSAASERRVEVLLNIDTGFICRREIPDKGCDYMTELVVDGRVRGYKFPIQLKSIETIVLVEANKFISYQIKTSRLGYMLQHIPTTGIFILYDTQTTNCYYDFSDSIYTRIMEDRHSDEWIHNEYVNIRVPLENELNEFGINNLKEKILTRFTQAAKMQLTYGPRYGLPIVSLLEEQFDSNNAEHLKQLFKKYGLVFLSQYDISVVYDGLENLSSLQINSDKDLLILAALAYCEVGKYLDSDLFQRKARAKFILSESEDRMLNFVYLKNKLQLGEMNTQVFSAEIGKLKGKSDLNNIIIDINILRYSIGNDTKIIENRSYKTELKNIYDRIAGGDIPDTTKQLYYLWNAANESLLLGNTFGYNITVARTSELLGNSLKLQEKKEKILSYLNDEKAFLRRITDIYNSATSSNNSFVRATALQLSAIHLFQYLLFVISFELKTNGLEQKIKNRAAEALESYNLFVGLQLNKDAHFSLHLAIELLDAAKAFFRSPVDEDLEQSIEIIGKMEQELMLQPIPRTIIEHINDKLERLNNTDKSGPMASLKGTSDAYLEQYAHIIMLSAKLPDERYNNVLNSLKNYRLFYDRCQSLDIVVREKPHDQSYKDPVIYFLSNLKTGFVSLESADMEYLLSSWGY